MVLLGQGAFMVLLSFAVLYGLASVLGIAEDIIDIRITFAFFVISCIAVYGSSFGVFAGVQKSTCGEVKNWKQIALNALIPTLFQVVLLSLALFIPWFQNIVGDLLPPDTPVLGKMATALAYYTFWATLLGGAMGGTMSGSCLNENAVFAELDNAILKVQAQAQAQAQSQEQAQEQEQAETQEALESLEESPIRPPAQVRFNLPPE